VERKYGLDSSVLGQGQVASCREHGIDPSVSVIGGKFIENLNQYRLLHEGHVPWVIPECSCFCTHSNVRSGT
jgi:hypothetical protein